MTTPVSFTLAKLLNSKGLPGLKSFYSNKKQYALNPKKYTIGDVVMWLYKNHGIWISVVPYNDEELSQTLWENKIIHINDDYNDCSDYTFYHSPTEAYEAAIEYCLTELI